MLIEAEAAQQAVETLRAEPRGSVRITCPVTLLHVHIGPMLARFMARYPGVTLHLEATNRRVDVVGEGIDVAIRVRPRPIEDSDLVMRVLADRGHRLVASTDLISRLGRPQAPSELSAWPGLSLGANKHQHKWQLTGPGGARAEVYFTPRMVTTDMLALREAAMAGVGVVQLPLLMVRDQLASGELEVVLDEWQPRREVIHAVFASRRGLLPSVRALVDYLSEEYQRMEDLPLESVGCYKQPLVFSIHRFTMTVWYYLSNFAITSKNIGRSSLNEKVVFIA